MTIGLMITPGDGFSEIEVATDATVATVVSDYNLHGRTITIDGEVVEPSNFANTSLSGVSELWATGGAKGA